MQSFLKLRHDFCKISVKEFSFRTVVDHHLASLLKNVTYPSQACVKELPKF